MPDTFAFLDYQEAVKALRQAEVAYAQARRELREAALRVDAAWTGWHGELMTAFLADSPEDSVVAAAEEARMEAKHGRD